MSATGRALGALIAVGAIAMPGANPYLALAVDDRVGLHVAPDTLRFPAVSAAPPLRSLTISKLYWFASVERPAAIPAEAVHADGSGHLLAHVEEYDEASGVAAYREFESRGPKGFVLSAPGRPEVPARWERGMWAQEFYLRIAPADLASMVPGIRYALRPVPTEGEFTWVVRDGVGIVRP